MVEPYCLHRLSGILPSRDGIKVLVSCVFGGPIQEVTIC